MALALAERFPCEIVSVDSVQLYRGFDIGSAKPSREERRRAPHWLIDLRDAEEGYSAGEFVRDARKTMGEVLGRGNIPLLSGGTMLYFRALCQGLAEIPNVDEAVRSQVREDLRRHGAALLHCRLAAVDPQAARRLHPHDGQRVGRALEVFLSSGVPLSEHQRRGRASGAADVRFLPLVLWPRSWDALERRIEARVDAMLAAGLVAEVRALHERYGDRRGAALPAALRSVGYWQVWEFLEGRLSAQQMRENILKATRRLAKHQRTWLRSSPLETRLSPAWERPEAASAERELLEDCVRRVRSFLGHNPVQLAARGEGAVEEASRSATSQSLSPAHL